MKRTIVILLTLALCMGGILGPAMTAYAASPTVEVNDIDLVADDDHTIACGEGTAVYDPATQTLTLTNAQITLPSSISRCAGVYMDGFTSPVTIHLVGNNSITLTDTARDNNGIWNDSSADLAITGSGSLEVLTYNDYSPFGIWNQKSDLSVMDAALSFALASGSKSNGFLADTNAITLDGATLTASGYMQGLFALGLLTIQNQSTVNMTAMENALYSEGVITIEDSTVTAETEDFTAICGWANINIADSVVTAHSIYDNGIYCYGKATVSGSEATITSDESDGFRANGGIAIEENAEVVAEGAAAVYTNDIVSVENSTLTAKGTSWAILAQRISANAANNAPAGDPTALTLGNGLAEASGAVIQTEDWVYTEVWDDWEYDYVDRWRSRSYFVDASGNRCAEVHIVAQTNTPPAPAVPLIPQVNVPEYRLPEYIEAEEVVEDIPDVEEATTDMELE